MTETIKGTLQRAVLWYRWRKDNRGTAFPLSQKDRDDPELQAIVKKRLNNAASDLKSSEGRQGEITRQLHFFNNEPGGKDHYKTTIRHRKRLLKAEEKHLAKRRRFYDNRWDIYCKAGVLQKEWGTKEEFLKNFDPFHRTTIISSSSPSKAA